MVCIRFLAPFTSQIQWRDTLHYPMLVRALEVKLEKEDDEKNGADSKERSVLLHLRLYAHLLRTPLELV